jgi:hypothetical protein
MSAHFATNANLPERILSLSLSGIFSEEEMRSFVAAYRAATDQFRGAKHMVIADMRGMKPLHRHIAKILGDEIGYARRNGVVLCVHLSDHAIQRLQAARVARENSPNDDVTVDVTSADEANRVIDERRSRLEDERYGRSIRDAL